MCGRSYLRPPSRHERSARCDGHHSGWHDAGRSPDPRHKNTGSRGAGDVPHLTRPSFATYADAILQPVFSSLVALLLTCMMFGACAADNAGKTGSLELLNVSYDPTR